MKNLFFRTSIAPYRIDFYNALNDSCNYELYFYRDQDKSIDLNRKELYKQCHFTVRTLNGIELGGSSRKFCFGLFKLLKKHKPDCIIVPEFQILTLQILFYRLFLRKKPKVVSMCDDSYDMISNKNDFTLIHRIARKLFVHFLDDIIVVEPRVRDWYQSKYNKGIWMPIIRDEEKEIRHYRELIPLSNDINKKYNLEGKKVVLFVGRLVPLKNIDSLFKAMDLVQEDCALVIVGDGPEKMKLEETAKKSKHQVIFTGLLQGDNLHAWYNIADVFCLLSYQEAFGAVVNEALLAGCHTIVSSKAGASCLIDESNGTIVDPFAIENIAKSISSYLSSNPEKENKIIPRPSKMTVSFRERIDNLKTLI